MTISLNDVKWGKYKVFEGPYHTGVLKFSLSENPSLEDKLIYVICQTEGGSYDAVNLYDGCRCSVGLIQFCEKFLLVSRLLGAVASELGVEAVTTPLTEVLKLSNATFKLNKNKQWRFFQNDIEVSTDKTMCNLYFGGSTGLAGQWTDAQKEIAKKWVVGLAKIWENPRAREVQVKFTASRLLSFVMPETKKVLFATEEWDGWKGSVKAAYLSFAANNPKLASDNFQIAIKTTTHAMWSPRWCIHVIKQLTFGPKIPIYPGRYDKIRPAIEKVFGITALPKTNKDLQEWSSDVVDVPPTSVPNEELRQVDHRETPTLPSPEAPVTPISEPPERELVFPGEASHPLPAPPNLPREARPTTRVVGLPWFEALLAFFRTFLK